ncbi:MAG: hypothetical protein RIB80_04785 [Rhodospirillales bacterium]
MTCRAQIKPPVGFLSPMDEARARSLEPDRRDCPSDYLRRAVGRIRAMGRPANHGPLCPSCFSDPDQGWNTATGHCGNCGHVKGKI